MSLKVPLKTYFMIQLFMFMLNCMNDDGPFFTKLP